MKKVTQIRVPNLRVFNAINKAILSLEEKIDLRSIAFICTQHELSTTINMLESLISLGANPKNIYLMGKYYSTCDAVADELLKLGIQRQASSVKHTVGDFASVFKNDIKSMWKKFLENIKNKSIKGIVILDDGGRCLATAPKEIFSRFPIVGIEQTTGGIVNPDTFDLPFPIIEVASSASKLWLESPLIASATITDKVEEILKSEKIKPLCGVVGTGSIGMAIIKKLISLGCEVIAFDKNHLKASQFEGFYWAESLEELIKQSKYLFGCTGYDITARLDIEPTINEDKYFFSCSSEDREFLSLLQLIQKTTLSKQEKNGLDNIVYQTKNGHCIEIFRGGFPITFDGSSQPSPANDIQLTQGLLLCALFQACSMLPDDSKENKRARVMLHPSIQQFVSSEWSKTQAVGRYPEDLLARFENQAWIMEHSGGSYKQNNYIERCFSKKTISVTLEELS
jgi:hypothetical protein